MRKCISNMFMKGWFIPFSLRRPLVHIIAKCEFKINDCMQRENYYLKTPQLIPVMS